MKSTVPWPVLLLAAICGPLVFSACTVEREVDFMAGTPVVESADLFGPGMYRPGGDAYAQIGWCRSPNVSPDGGQIFFVSGLSGVPQLYRLTERNWPLQLTFFPDGIDWYVLSHKGELAIVGACTDGSENSQLFLVETGSGRVRRLTDNPNTAYGSVVWDRDDRAILLHSTEENGHDFKLYRMDLATAEVTKLLDLTGYNSWEDISVDGRWMVFSRGNPARENNLYLYDLSTGDTTQLTSAEKPARYQGARFDAKGERLYLTSDANGQDLMLRAVIDLDDKKVSFPEPNSPWNVDNLALSPSRQIMAWVTNQDGYSRLHLADLDSGKELPAPKLNGLISEPILSESSSLFFVFESSTQAPAIRSWDWIREELYPLSMAAYAGVDSTALVEPKPVVFGSFDGVQIQAWLYLPADYTRGPITFIMNLPDGPERQSRPSFDPAIQYLVSRGYGVFSPNVRGSGGFGRRFAALDDYRLRGNAVKDVQAGVEWLIQNEYTRPDLAGIAGKGYGGYLVLAAITEYPQTFAAAWAQGAVADVVACLEDMSPWQRDRLSAEFGPSTDLPFLRSISPIARVDRIRTPLMIVHGVNDPQAPIGQIRQLIDALRNRGATVDSLLLANEGHDFRQPLSQSAALTAMGAFFDTHLRGNPNDTLKTR
ncbi:MAG: S9 family peptidase [candidate division Zixibacteria bacterium]|nr:S9 family peptidase [candidate division Zixibacteria bacterium]